MSLKALKEKKNELVSALKEIISAAETETRALTNEEQTEFDRISEEIRDIDGTIERTIAANSFKPNQTSGGSSSSEELETRAFENYVRGVVSERADDNLTAADNGAVIPTSIVNKIIAKVTEICPIYELATKYVVGGTLTIPKYDESTHAITMAYASEFSDLESTSGRFSSITLTGFLAGALSKISKSLVNNSNFDIVNYVIGAMAKSIARWIENELLNGTANKITGLSGVAQSQITTAASTTAITADELIDVQESIPDAYQGGAIWIMNKATRKAIRKLKDLEGNYLLNRDLTSRWGYTLLGKDVYISDNMPAAAAGKTTVYYGDMSGLAVKLSETASIEILRERFATQHVIGVVAWLEMDAKIEDDQKIAALKMKAA